MTRLLPVLLLLAAALPLAAQQVLVDRTYDPKTGTRCVVRTLVSTLPTSGYVPVRVTLLNGSKIDRSWSFRFRSYDTGWTDDNSEVRSSFAGSCAAGQSASYEFLVPVVTTFQESYASTAELEVDVGATALPSVAGGMSSFYDAAWPSVMMSSSLFRTNASPLDSATENYLRSASSAGGSGSSVRFAGQFDPGELSGEWLAYSGYDHCFLTEKDWRDLGPGARSALLQWNRLGGSLLVCSANAGLTLESLGIASAQRNPREGVRSWGICRIVPLDASGNLDPADTVSLITATIPGQRGANRLQAVRNEFAGSWPLLESFGSKTAHLILFVLVLVAFGILVGPVNLFVFAKSGQRHRLFITTPIISIGASLLLILLIIFQDGFGGRGQRVVLMEVRPDDSENAAYLAQEQVARTGVLFGTGFTTSDRGYISPVLLPQSRWARMTQGNQGGNNRFQSDPLENGLQLAGDWFQSRSEHGHVLEAVRPTRGRLEFSLDGSVPVVTSTFDFPLEQVFVIDADGEIWSAEDVQQGRRTSLAVSSEPVYRAWLSRQIGRFTSRNGKRLQLCSTRRGHFVASSTAVGGVATLDSVSWKDDYAVITGPTFTP